MSALTNKKNSPKKTTTPTSVSDVIVRRSLNLKLKAPMMTANVIPAGTYRSTVVSVEDAVSEEGKAMADVTYRFMGVDGKTVDARVRYPIVGYHIGKLMDALISAGLPEGASLTDAVGIEEEVTVVYPHEGALGKIKSRCPLAQAVKAGAKKPANKKLSHRVLDDDADEQLDGEEPEELDDEFDDFLEEDEE